MAAVACIISAQLIAASTLAFIPPTSSSTRVASFTAIACLSASSISHTNRLTDDGQALAEYTFGFMLHANAFLVILKLSPPPERCETAFEALKWATCTVFSPRRGIPNSQLGRVDKNKHTFLAKRLLTACATGSTYYYFCSHPILVRFPMAISDYAPDKDSLLLQPLYLGSKDGYPLARLLLVRIEITAKSLFLPALVLSTVHSSLSILAVCLLLSTPSDWPPLFGNIFDAYTLTRWYSHFWPKLMRRGFTVNARFLLDLVFESNGSRSPVLRRAAVVLLSFAISGLMHTASGWAGQEECGAGWRPFWAFVATGVAVVGEQVVLGACLHPGQVLHVENKLLAAALRVLGYCWVIVWWLEIIPRVVFPGVRCRFYRDMQ